MSRPRQKAVANRLLKSYDSTGKIGKIGVRPVILTIFVALGELRQKRLTATPCFEQSRQSRASKERNSRAAPKALLSSVQERHLF